MKHMMNISMRFIINFSTLKYYDSMPFTNKFHLLNLDYAICTQHVAHAAKSGLSQLDVLNLPLTSDAVVVKRYVSRNY